MIDELDRLAGAVQRLLELAAIATMQAALLDELRHEAEQPPIVP